MLDVTPRFEAKVATAHTWDGWHASLQPGPRTYDLGVERPTYADHEWSVVWDRMIEAEVHATGVLIEGPSGWREWYPWPVRMAPEDQVVVTLHLTVGT